MGVINPGQSGSAALGKEEPLSADERILHLLQRFSLGVTPGLIADVRAAGIEVWLDAQLAGVAPRRRADEPADPLAERLAPFELLALSNFDLVEFSNREGNGAKSSDELRAWVLLRAVYGADVVREVACDFFRNHFTVSLEKDEVRFVGLAYERDVIRAHALGSFHDMLDASARHPAMLIYLDNHLSRRAATNSELRRAERDVRKATGSADRAREARDITLQSGLNENYARELLELHTLGVDRYYDQNDVVSVARALTGWTFDRATWEFVFRLEMHDRDRKQFQGRDLKPKQDESEGAAILDLLKRHPGTAQFLAWKLCRWLVHDEPDEAMVRRIADVFQRNRGDLRRVLRAIVLDRDFFARRNFQAKYKRPFEFVVSALRATDAQLDHCGGVLAALDSMSESIYQCPDPTGYYDQAEAWRDPGALAFRWAFAIDLVFGRVRGVRVPSSLYEELEPGRPEQWRDVLVRRILPVTGVGPATSAALDRLLRRGTQMARVELGAHIVALLLGSPEFQRQ